MDKLFLLEGTLSTRVWWRYTAMDSGALCVMTHLDYLKLTLCADNWDTLLPIAMTTSLSENNTTNYLVHVHWFHY